MGRSRLEAVKIVRVCFLLLLVLLLPLRGAVAAAMMCPPPAGHMPQAAAVQGDLGDLGAARQHHNAHQSTHHDAHHDHSAHPDAMGSDHTEHGALLQTQAPLEHGDMPHADAPAPAAADHGLQEGKCNLCAATCSLSTLPGQAPRMPTPPDVAATRFPPLAVPTPSFLSGGQDRPPRSI